MILSLPDLETLRLCSMLSSFAFATMFGAFWVFGRRQPYLLHWAASAALYPIVLQAFAGVDRHSMLLPATFGLLAGTDVLIMTGVIAFHRRSHYNRREIGLIATAVTVPILAAFGSMTPIVPASIAPDLGMIGLATPIALIGCWLVFGGARDVPLGQRLAGIALLAYVPVYALAIAAGHIGLGGLHLTAVLPMIADQMILPALNIALMAMPAERSTRALREKAYRDPLTGARNRAWLDSYRAEQSKTDDAVIIVDIDHFKRINDNYGHAAGDKVLANFAARATEVLEAEQGILARLGGDEFIAIVPDADAERAAKIATDLLGSMKIWTPGVPVATASLGVAIPDAGDDFSGVMARADRHLYNAKAAGRDRVAVD